MCKSAKRLECCGCQKSFTPALFSAHIAICRKIERAGLSACVMDVVKVSSRESTAHYEFKMKVGYAGLSWYVFKRFKQFYFLHKKVS